jgi:hypothetical protein
VFPPVQYMVVSRITRGFLRCSTGVFSSVEKDPLAISTFVAAAVFLYVQLVSGFSPAQHEVFSGVENCSF